MQTHTHCTHSYACAHLHTRADTHTHTRARADTHTRVLTHTYARAHTHAHLLIIPSESQLGGSFSPCLAIPCENWEACE